MDEHRLKKLKKLQDLHVNPYANSYKIALPISKIIATYNNCSHDDLLNKNILILLPGE